jgi:hypothetical protein
MRIGAARSRRDRRKRTHLHETVGRERAYPSAMRTHVRSLALAIACFVVGCGSGPDTPQNDAAMSGNDAAMSGRDSGSTPIDTGVAPMDVAGMQSGMWCGPINVTANVTVAAGQTLTICAGSTVTVASGAGISVAGTLNANGTAAAPVTMTSAGTWSGIVATGMVTLTYVDIDSAGATLRVNTGSTVTLSHSTITGGDTELVAGGMLTMTDSTIDLGHTATPPDCINVASGGITLDHTHITGCHCPVHIDAATMPNSITASILDGAANSVMIANATATITGNDLASVSAIVDDIGSGAGITCDVSGNYWTRGTSHAVSIYTRNMAQFTGADAASAATGPVAGAGPR